MIFFSRIVAGDAVRPGHARGYAEPQSALAVARLRRGRLRIGQAVRRAHRPEDRHNNAAVGARGSGSKTPGPSRCAALFKIGAKNAFTIEYLP